MVFYPPQGICTRYIFPIFVFMEKPDLLLLHGALGTKNQFHELITLLEDSFEIYTLDFSGHGEKAPKNEFGIITFANEVLDEMARWDLDRVNIFGYSMGGYVATYLALHTNRVLKAFTLGTKFLWTPEYAENETRKLDPNKILQKVPAFAEELKARHSMEGWTRVLEKTKEMITGLGNHNLLTLDNLNEIDSEICIGLGDGDSTVGVDESVSVYHALKNGNICVFPNTMHPFEKLNLTLLAASIRQFI